jgi:hypothetical protein
MAISLTGVGIFGLQAVTANAASAASCSAAVCNYENSGYSGSMLPLAKNVCGVYNNLGDQGWNDRISSIDNWVAATQYFWQHSNKGGGELTVGGYAMWSNLSTIGWNDQISSLSWTG